ncbi:MAG: DUF2157 domain-containing protein [Agarilytica sp.]
MNNYRKWLLGEVELWQSQGIIDASQANQITGLYPYHQETNWGKVIFAGIGAIIFGLGIILVFAYNWEAMHRFTKLGIVLLSVAVAHVIGFHYSREHSAHKRIGESLHLLGTMLFGAGIWLIAQIYHIDEHYPNAFLVWALGAMAMGWVLPSLGHTFLALVLVFLWHWFETFEFRSVNHGAVWLVLLGILPIALIMRSLSALFLTCCMLIFSYSISYSTVAERSDETLVCVMLVLSGVFILGSHLAVKSQFPQCQNVLRVVGVGVFSVLLFIVTFDEFDRVRFENDLSTVSTVTWFYFAFPVVAFSVALARILMVSNLMRDKTETLELVLVAATVYVAVLSVFPVLGIYKAVWVFYSIAFLAYSVLLIYRGSLYLRWQSTTLGGLMLSAYTFARFMDLFDSLLMRGMAFLVVGAMLFGIGIYYSRQKQFAEQARGVA